MGFELGINAAVYLAGMFKRPGVQVTGAGGEVLTLSGQGTGLNASRVSWNSKAELAWARTVGRAGTDLVTVLSMTANAAGHVYLTGDFTNSSGSQLIVGGLLDENPVVLQGQGGDDVYVANWAPNGDLTWVRTIGSTGRDRVFQLRVGPAGSVYLSGINAPSIVVGGNGVPSTTVQATQYGVFVAVWSGCGEFQWLRTADGGDVYPGDLQLDAQGRVYLGGGVRPACRGC